jgi:DNA-binding CsgD family transcriptional regulator
VVADGVPALDEFPPSDACVLTDAEWEAINGTLHLTARELDIARHLMLGRCENGIAVHLGISANTVHTHLGRVYKKVGVRSAAGLVRRMFAAYVAISRAR